MGLVFLSGFSSFNTVFSSFISVVTKHSESDEEIHEICMYSEILFVKSHLFGMCASLCTPVLWHTCKVRGLE